MRRIVLTSLVRISGRKLMALFALSVPFGVLQGFVEIAFGFALVYFLASYDLIAPDGLPAYLQPGRYHPVAVLIGVGFLRTVFTFLSTITSNLCYESFCAAVRRSIAEMLAAKSARLSVADASNTLSNLLPKSANFLSACSQATTQALILLVTLGGLYGVSPRLTFIALGSVALLGLPVVLSRRMFQSYSSKVYANTKKFTDRLLKDIRNLDFLRIVGRTRSESDALTATSRRIMRDYLGYIFWITANSSWPQFGGLCIISLVVVFNRQHAWVAAAALIPFVYMLSRATTSAGEMVRALGNLQFNWPFLRNLTETLSAPASSPAAARTGSRVPPGEAVTSLTVEGLSVGRTKPLLEGLSFRAGAGDFICFNGESGRGKTTLLMTLIGLVPSLKGRILWNRFSVDEVDSLEFRNRVAYSGADPFLLDISVRENLLLGNEGRAVPDGEIQEALGLTGCEFVSGLPGGLDYTLMEGGEGISAGQKQRLSLARAILRRPDVLLLDEATANVDIETEAAIIGNVRAFLPRALILAVSHRPSILKYSTLQIAL